MHRYLVTAAAVLAFAAAHAAPAGAAFWTEPEAISDLGSSASSLAVMPDASSDVTATWRGGAAIAPSYAERSEGFWGQPDTLAAKFTNAVRLATNSAGDAVAVWDGCSQTCLWAAVREAGGAWGTATLVSGSLSDSVPHYDYSAAVDPDGDATVIFKRGDGISTRTRPAEGNWGAVEAVVTDASARARGLGVAADGTLSALWTAAGLSGTEAKLAVRPPLGAWQSPVTVAGDVSEISLHVAAGGDAAVISRTSTGALSSRVRKADGELQNAQTIATGPVYSARAAIGTNGHIVAAWDEGVEVRLASRAPDAAWSEPLTVPVPVPAIAVDAAGNAVLASEHIAGDDQRSLHVLTVSAGGAIGPLHSIAATTGREITPAVAVTPDGHATAIWLAGTSGAYAVHAISTTVPIGSATPPEDGEEEGQTPDPGGGPPPVQHGSGEPAPNPGPAAPPPPSGPAVVDTLRTVAMPNLVGRDESAAKDAVGDAGIQGRFSVVLSHRKPPRGRRVGDVILQAPKPNTQVTSGFATLLPIKLTVYGGPPRGRAKCPRKVVRSLRSGLRGADLVAAERVAEKQGCFVQRNFRIADVDEAQVTAISQPGGRRNGRPIVQLTVSVPSDVAKNDLFLGFRENPNQLSFGADDWALTASRDQRNFLTVTVKNRTAAPIPGTDAVLHGVEDGAELHFDTTDVGAPVDPPVQKSDKTGQLMTSVFAPKAGTIDVIAVKTGANGLSMYGIGRLSVRDRKLKVGGSYRTTGGRLLQRAADGFFCKEGPGTSCKLPFSYIKEGARASAFDPFGGFANLLSSLLGSFGTGNASVDAAKREIAPGRSPLETVQAVFMHRIQVMQFAFSSRPLSSQARAIAAGGGNVIAAGGGNVIAAGGGNVIAAGGGNAIAAGGGNVIAAGGGNAIAAGGGNVIAAGGGNVIRLPGGGQAILPQGGNAIAAGGGNAIAAGGGNLFPVSSAIAAGGGN